MSDEGYRSLGIIQDKNKQVPSHQSSFDATENAAEHQQIYTGDELNDYGLRKTQFSHIYEDGCDEQPSNKPKLEQWLQHQECEEAPKQPHQPVEAVQKGRDRDQMVKRAQSVVGTGIGSPALHRKQRSFCTSSVARNSPAANVETKLTSAVARMQGAATSPKKSDSKKNTWSGRPKATRHTLTSDTFVSPFQRNTAGRRSTSAVNFGNGSGSGNGSRRSSSANSSPTKSRLKQELLQTVKHTDDESTIVEQENWLSRRNEFGHMSLLRELQANDPNDFRNYLRMAEDTFKHLFNLVGLHFIT
nr:unnamed protein product [Callosobruchus chinensis]